MNKLNLSAPWYTHQKKLAGIFQLDDEVTVGPITEDDAGGMSVAVSVTNHAKAEALSKLLKKSVPFGNVSLTVNVVDTSAAEAPADIAKAALAYNRLVRRVSTETVFPDGGSMTYVIFEPDVCQFFNDDLTDYQRNFNSLFEDVARDVFEELDCVSFCTVDVEEN